MELKVRIGPMGFCFICPSKYWHTLIKKRYHTYLDNKLKNYSTINIFSVNRSFSFTKKPEISRLKDKTIISRYDFFSASNNDLLKVDLAILENKYSFDSWFRIFITLRALPFKGVLLHSSGFCHNKSVFLFAGESGRGKSTIIKILGKDKALSDELVLVYKKEAKTVYACGTPFWGELTQDPGWSFNDRLRALFFIKHSKSLRVSKVNKIEAVSRLLKTTLFFSKSKLEHIKLLDAIRMIAEKIPAYELGFTLKTKKSDILNILSGVLDKLN